MRIGERYVRRAAFHALAGGAAAAFTLPLLWVVIASLRPAGLPPPRSMVWLPEGLALENYRAIFTLLPLGRYLGNSLLVAAVAVPLTVVIASSAGFAMARLPNPLRRWLVLLAVLLRMIPLTTLWLPRFLIFAELGLTDSLWALTAPAWMGTSPFYVLLFYWAFRRVPTEVFDAARLDGAGALLTWARVAMPMAMPTAGAVATFAFVHYWSDFINPLLYLRSDRNYTLPVGLRALQQLDPTGLPLLLAGAVVMLLPVLALFLATQHMFWLAEAPSRS